MTYPFAHSAAPIHMYPSVLDWQNCKNQKLENTLEGVAVPNIVSNDLASSTFGGTSLSFLREHGWSLKDRLLGASRVLPFHSQSFAILRRDLIDCATQRLVDVSHPGYQRVSKLPTEERRSRLPLWSHLQIPCGRGYVGGPIFDTKSERKLPR